jgi:hypothetical protein
MNSLLCCFNSFQQVLKYIEPYGTRQIARPTCINLGDQLIEAYPSTRGDILQQFPEFCFYGQACPMTRYGNGMFGNGIRHQIIVTLELAGFAGKKVISLVIHDNKGREILYFNPPDGLHAEFLKGLDLDFLDIILGKDCRRSTDGS